MNGRKRMLTKEDIFGIDEIAEDGLYLIGSDENCDSGFNVHALSDYVKQNNISQITEEVIEQARKEGAIY